MFQKILVPLDGTELAEGILPYISQLANGLDAPMVLFTVVDPDSVEIPERLRGRGGDIAATHIDTTGTEVFSYDIGFAGFAPPGPGIPGPVSERGMPHAAQYYEEAGFEAKTRLQKMAKRLEGEGVQADVRVSFGSAAEEIVRTVNREGCDLVAMSTHGRSMLGRGILGSVTDKVVHSSHVPVLTITPDMAKNYWQEDTKITRILVPLDGSTIAESVLPYVEALAKKLSLEVVLARVVKIGGMYSIDIGGSPSSRGLGFETEAESDAVEYLNKVGERLRANGVNVQQKLLRGAPAQAIVELAHEMPQDIVSLTTHGRSGFTRWALGSVAEALVRASGDPVLIIPPPQAVS